MNSNNINKVEVSLKLRSNISERLKAVGEQIGESLRKNIEPFLKDIGKTLKELPEGLKNTIQFLANYGWFIPFDMELPEINSLIVNKKYVELDNYMCNIIESKLEQIEKKIIYKCPERKKIIKSAFNANKNGEYELSIPVFLAQADGICNEELIGENLYSRKDGEPKTKEKVKMYDNDSMMTALTEPLRNPNIFNARKSEKKFYSDILNRNKILHGEMIDYGYKVNSMKAISLLNYLVSMIDEFERYKNIKRKFSEENLK